MPSKSKKKDNVSKNMGSRYSFLEPQNIRSKPHSLVIDLGNRESSSSAPTANPTPMDWQSAPSGNEAPATDKEKKIEQTVDESKKN